MLNGNTKKIKRKFGLIRKLNLRSDDMSELSFTPLEINKKCCDLSQRFRIKKRTCSNIKSNLRPDGTSGLSLRGRAGFSFFEIMTTVAVLSLGIVMIFQAFFTSLNCFGYYLTNLQVQCWADEKIWEMSDDLTQENSKDNCQTNGCQRNGNLILADRDISWIMEVNRMDEQEDFFELDLTVSWQEGKRKVELYRTAYAGI